MKNFTASNGVTIRIDAQGDYEFLGGDFAYYVRRGGSNEQALREYFIAHQKGWKPWHEAKPGEVWVLAVDGETYAWGVGSGADAGRFIYAGGESNIPLDHPSISEGRRIWHKEAE